MEEPIKTQQSSSVGKSKLRYPLRSASKPKEQTYRSPEIANNSSKRRMASSMSKSVSVLELSGKEKDNAAKPPRRLSIPAKSVSPRLKSASITPISEAAKSKRLGIRQDRCETPLSDVSRSSTRRKFNILSSASYWLSQIKLSESAAKHSISLGFFKLAHQAGCEPIQRLREELQSYVQRHNLTELGDTVRSLFESYEISETLEQLQESVVCSHVPEEATSHSGEDVQSTSSTAATRKLKPKSLNTDDTQASSAKASSKKGSVQRTTAVIKTRASVNRDPVKPKLVTESGGNNINKKVQKAGKQESHNAEKIKQDEEPVSGEVTANAQYMVETLEGNKENLDAPLMGEVSVTEEF